MNLERFERFPLAHLPTPLERLRRLSAYLHGPEIWIKRDDCTGLADGGNKTRKLEYLLTDALAHGADTLVTIGGIQSNHTRQTAAAAARAGLCAVLVLERWVNWPGENYERVGNILLSRILGAHIEIGAGPVASASANLADAAERVRSEGGVPYIIPSGASDHPLGGLGYAHCAREILQQSEQHDVRFAAVVHATSSGSTQAGLIVGFAALGATCRVIGIDVDAAADTTRAAVLRIARSTAALVDEKREIAEDDVQVEATYASDSYGLPSGDTIEAIRLVGRLEGILLDPVYEGKAMAGLIDMIRRQQFESTDQILFLHLGGRCGPCLRKSVRTDALDCVASVIRGFRRTA
jgi:1-aminocyclopropane-1-carboxylate deaminase